jgi:hypothetical protein
MSKLPDELKERVKKIVEEILDNSLPDSRVEELSRKWIECIKEILDYNKVDYKEEDLGELRDNFLKILEFIRKHKDSDSVDGGSI